MKDNKQSTWTYILTTRLVDIQQKNKAFVAHVHKAKHSKYKRMNKDMKKNI